MEKHDFREVAVKISTKTRYGMRVMLDLAECYADGRTPLKDIAERQGLSKKYLEQVVAPLSAAGLLTVTRGYLGGYQLARPPEAITLADVIAASEDGLELMECTGDLLSCERAEACPSRRVWSGLQGAVNEYLATHTLADMVNPS